MIDSFSLQFTAFPKTSVANNKEFCSINEIYDLEFPTACFSLMSSIFSFNKPPKSTTNPTKTIPIRLPKFLEISAKYGIMRSTKYEIYNDENKQRHTPESSPCGPD
jgi:hypothetical protein